MKYVTSDLPLPPSRKIRYMVVPLLTVGVYMMVVGKNRIRRPVD